MSNEEMRRIILLRTTVAFFLASTAVVSPNLAVADHGPDGLARDIDPNLIACLMAVDDAEPVFLYDLQNTCLIRTVEICGGRDASTAPSQVVDCIYFETRRGIDFLQSALAELPEAVESGGFFELRYKRLQDSVLGDLEAVRTSPKPESIQIAIHQISIMWASATTLFYLARETETPLEAHVVATFSSH